MLLIHNTYTLRRLLDPSTTPSINAKYVTVLSKHSLQCIIYIYIRPPHHLCVVYDASTFSCSSGRKENGVKMTDDCGRPDR